MPRETPENVFFILVEYRQFKIPKGKNVCGTYDVPQTLCRRSADVAADLAADVDCTERPGSIPDSDF